MTTPQPQWRYVPFVSTLLMCSGIVVLLHGAPAPPTRPLTRDKACEAVDTAGAPQSLSQLHSGEDADSLQQRGDAAQPFVAASDEHPSDTEPLDSIAAADPTAWSSIRLSALGLRGPPSNSDEDGRTHRLGTGPFDSSLDAADDDDDGDDDPDTDDGDGVAALVAASADVSCALQPSSLLSRVEVHHPVSFTSDVQSLRAPPQ